MKTYKAAAYKAKERGHKFELSFDEYQDIISQPCAYCGTHEKKNGIDQIVPSAGYTLYNCAPCCSTCNYMKRCLSVNEFFEHISKIQAYQDKIKQRLKK